MKILLAATLALTLAACASKPPQPHGSPFPINRSQPAASATDNPQE